MFKKVFLSLCASVLVYGCSDAESNDTPAPSLTEKINLIATSSAGVETTLPALRYNLQNLSTPESIVVRGTDLFISNIGGGPGVSPELGFITKFDGTNNVKLTGTTKLDDPKGFAFMKDEFVFVSNHPNITLMKIKADGTYEVVSSLPVEGVAGFLNDVVALNDTTALVSDTGKGMIHKVTIKADGTGFDIVALANINAQTINGINGLAYNATTRMLYFVTSTFGVDKTHGDLYSVQLDNTFNVANAGDLVKWNDKQIGAGGLDGLVLINDNTKLIFSDWGTDNAENASKLYIYDVATKTLLTTISGAISAAADITVSGTTLYIPEFSKSKIVTVDISLVD